MYNMYVRSMCNFISLNKLLWPIERINQYQIIICVFGLAQYYFVIFSFIKTGKMNPFTRHQGSHLSTKQWTIFKLAKDIWKTTIPKTPSFPRFIHFLGASLRREYGHNSPGNRASSQKRFRTRVWSLSLYYCAPPSAIFLTQKKSFRWFF